MLVQQGYVLGILGSIGYSSPGSGKEQLSIFKTNTKASTSTC
jgi:hypothetical protein